MANDTATRVLQSARAAEGQERADDAARQDAERRDRAEVEARSGQSLRELSDIARVHEDARGQVVTLDSGMLFAFGRATLLESARAKLDRVADALRRAGDERRMVIEGHTDGLGADAQNLPLSRDRAQAVRQHLIRRGVDPARVTAIGLGSSRPLIDNGSPANRANNRRVEIVIRPAGLTNR
jgi:outer membrane protein OmpA-like peptidoglycan-associated protein